MFKLNLINNLFKLFDGKYKLGALAHICERLEEQEVCTLGYTRPYFRKQKLKEGRKKENIVFMDNQRLYTD